jgi:hypothetical protein
MNKQFITYLKNKDKKVKLIKIAEMQMAKKSQVA